MPAAPDRTTAVIPTAKLADYLLAPDPSRRSSKAPIALAAKACRGDTLAMPRLSLIAALALAFSATAQAQTAPKGWKVETTPNVWIATSPEAVRLAYYPVVKSRATFVFWFEEEGLRRTYGFGRTVGNEDPSRRTMDPDAGPLLAQSRTLVEANGAQTAVMSYAWETKQGRQMAQIVLPVTVGVASPAYKAAFAELTAAWKADFAWTPAPKAG
jgi:hypothetical protein